MIDELKNKIIIVNAPRGSGIGTFGWQLRLELEKKNLIEYVEIDPTWKGFFSLWLKIRHRNLKIIFNLGFTSFGKSVYKNFFNFIVLKAYSIINPFQSVILHDSIDTSNLEYSGYSTSRFMRIGGAIATGMIKNYNIFVFSRAFYDILKKKYGFNSVNYFPFPTESDFIMECYNPEGKPLLLNLGYIAPYKGLDILPELKLKLNNIKTMIIGNFYGSYMSTKKGPQFKRDLINLMHRSEINMAGYMDELSVIKLIKENKTVAVLPYISGYNASYSALFFVKLGIPVVATNLDVFSESQNNGAGIILANRTPEDFTNAINMLFDSGELTLDLINKDKQYCRNYSMSKFCEFILKRITEK